MTVLCIPVFRCITKNDFDMTTFALALMLELKNSCRVLEFADQKGNLNGIDLIKLSIDVRIIYIFTLYF